LTGVNASCETNGINFKCQNPNVKGKGERLNVQGSKWSTVKTESGKLCVPAPPRENTFRNLDVASETLQMMLFQPQSWKSTSWSRFVTCWENPVTEAHQRSRSFRKLRHARRFGNLRYGNAQRRMVKQAKIRKISETTLKPIKTPGFRSKISKMQR
jgi:hypothetical protein